MNIAEGITFAGFMISSVGFMWKMSSDIKKISDDEANKRARIYTRLDEKAKELDNKKVDTKTCDILHLQTARDIEEIKRKVECIPQIKAGIDLLLKPRAHD